MKAFGFIAFTFLLSVAADSRAVAETITFEADTEVLIIRIYNQFGFATVEFIGAPGAFYQCVSIGADGQPIAATPAMADLGSFSVEGVDAAAISDVKCRKVM